MTEQEQDKFWAELSQGSRDRIKKEYRLASLNSVENITAQTYRNLFGEHNLEPTLTYEDISRELFGYNNKEQYGTFYCPVFSEEHCDKISAINALICVAKSLNKNEDGSDWELTIENWENADDDFYTLGIDPTDNEIHVIAVNKLRFATEIVYFRTEEIAQQAIRILGEECIRTALTTNY